MKKIYSILLFIALVCCGTVRAEQLNEGFEGTTFAPEGWTTIHVSGSSSYIWKRYTSSYGTPGHESASYAQMDYASSGHENYLITPQLKPEAGEKLTFYTSQKYSGSTTVTIEVSTTTAEASAFTTTIFTYTDVGASYQQSAWAKQEVDLTTYVGQDIYIAFHVVDDNGYSFYLDDVSGVTIKPEDCPKPQNLQLTATLFDGATFTWEQGASETAYQYAVVAKGGTPADGDWANVEGTERTLTLHNLSSGVSRDFYLRSNCDSEHQSTGVMVNFTPLCPAPMSPVATPTGTKTASLTWTGADGITDYQYVVLVKGATEDWTNAVKVEGATSAEITGLTANTEYDVYVRSFYNDASQSASVKAASFRTDCDVYELPFEQNFNSLTTSGEIPSCWDNSEGTTTNKSYKWSYAYSGHEGRCVRFDSYYNGYKTNVLATPTIHLDKNSTLNFWFKNAKGGDFTVSISSNGGKRDTLFTALTGITDWTEKEADLTKYTGTDVVIYFCGTSNDGSGDAYIYLDDVTVKAIPACAAPNDLAASDVLYNSAKLSWTAGGAETAWNLQVKVADGEWTAVDAVITNPYTLNGLENGKVHYARVQAACSSESQSEWSDEVSFTPNYAAPTAVTVDAITTTGATVTWTANSGETAWTLTYRQVGATDWIEIPVATDPTQALSGLEAGTGYQVQIWAGNASSSIANFSTACVASVSAPLKWDFESLAADATPNCWTVGGTSETLTSSPEFFWGVYEYSSNKSLRMYNYSIKAGTAFITTPAIVLPAATQELVFDYSHRANCGEFTVKISDDEGANWTDLKAFEKNSTYTSSDMPDFQTVEAISLAGYESKTILLQFFATANWGQGAIFVDNLELRNAPTCIKPVYSQIDITDHSATVEMSKNANYQFRFKKASETDFYTTTVSGMIVNLSPLNPNTLYDFEIRAICAEGDTSEWTSTQFTTACATETLPFTEGFESALSSCWDVGSNWSIYTWSGYKGSQSIRYTSSSNNDLVLPAIAINDKAQLSFWRQSNYVSCSVYANSVLDENKLADFANASDWTESVVDLSAFVGQTVRLIIRGNYYSGSRYLYIDSVSVNYLPVAAPTNVAADPKDASAIVTWESSDEATSWNLQYKADSTNAEWITVNGLTEKTYTITGLDNGQAYLVQVQAIVNENRKSDWSASANVTPVACASVTGVTFGERTYNSIVVNWTADAEAASWFLRYKPVSESNWYIAAGAITEKTFTLTNLVTEKEYTVEVKASCGETWFTAPETFTLAYTAPVATVSNITDQNAVVSWSAVADADSYLFRGVVKGTGIDWTKANPITKDKTSVTFGGLSPNAEYDVYVGAVYGEHIEAAEMVSFKAITIAPENLAVSEVTATSAKLTWEFDGDASITTKFQYALGDDPDALVWTKVAAASVELTELTPNTSYTFYVRTLYGNNENSDSIKLSFHTECAAFTIPFAQDFNGVIALQDTCWNADSWTLNTSKGVGGSQCARLDCGAYPATTNELASPVIALDEDAILKFWFKNEKGGEFRVLIGAEGVAERDTLVKNLTGVSAWTLQEIDLTAYTGNNAQLFFVGTTNGKDAEILVDDITITKKPTCLKPTGLTTSDETFEGATFSWTAGGSETTWNLRYKAADAEDWTSIAAANPQMLYGLNTGVQYTVQVQATCDDTEKSEWSDAITFTPQYLAPWDVAAADVTTSSAKISWTARSGELAWTLQYGKVGGTLHEINVTENPFVLTDLDAGTKYEARIVAGVAPNAAYSDYVTFTTECAAIAELPWSEDFNSFTADKAPNCWAVKNANDAGHAIIVAGESIFVETDGNALLFKGNYDQDTAFAILPEFSADLSNAQISFTHVGEKDGMGKLAFGYFVGEDFTSLLALDAVKTAVTIDPFVLPALPDGAHLAFAFKMNNTDDYNYYLAIDNILIEEKPECAVPTNVTVHSITAEGASFAFDSDAEKFNYMIRKAGEEWSAPIEINSTGFWLALDANTEYEFQVRAVCAGVADPSLWSEVVSFKTLCEVEAMPFYEGFEGGVPECWSAEGSWITDEYIAHEGKSLRFNAKNNSGSLSTPKIEITEADAVLIYYFRNTYGGTNHVGGSVTIKAGEKVLDSAFVDTKGESLERREISLADFVDLNVTITFNVQSVNASASVFIDSVRVVSKPCATPKNVQVEPGDGSAIVTWEPSEEEETAWKLTWGEKESMSWTGTYDPITETTFEITGLENGVEYGVQVYSFCDEAHTSSHTEVVYFTPSEPTGMENINAKDNAVKFVENGVLYILRDGVIYNAQGARVNK